MCLFAPFRYNRLAIGQFFQFCQLVQTMQFTPGIRGRRGEDEGGHHSLASEANLQGGALRRALAQGSGRQEQLAR